MKRLLFITQGTLQLFVGLSAIVSGGMLIIYPSGELIHVPLEMLYSTPFRNFLIPGIILFTINGIGQLFSSILTFKNHSLSSLFGTIFGIGLMIWIFVQVNMIGGKHFLQYIYFFVGVIETALAFLICRNYSS